MIVPIGPKITSVNGNITIERINGLKIDLTALGKYLTNTLSNIAITGTINKAGTMFEVYLTVINLIPKIDKPSTPVTVPEHRANMMNAATYSLVFKRLAAAKATITGK